MATLINRPEYLEKLRGFKDIQLVKIVTGIRRCGKSTLFRLFQNELKASGVNENQIQEINLEEAENAHLMDWQALHEYIKERLVTGKMNYIFIDEIQQVNDFPRVVNSLRLKENVDLYLTGSNAYMFAGKITTLVAGRYVEIKMLPLSFKEYMSAFSDADPAKKYRDYVEQSSFPQTLDFKGNKPLIKDYLEGLYNTVIRKDIILRKNIKDSSQFENLTRFLFDSIGSEISVRSIFGTLKNELKMPIQPPVINDYLDSLVESYIFYKAPRYDIKGKKFLKTNAKYYAVDVGLRYVLLGKEGSDLGHILENIVYLELLRRGYKVSVGQVNGTEVDFVAEKDGFVEYYQISQDISSAKTFEREFASLDAIRDHNRKVVLTMEYTPAMSRKGIVVLNVLDWLLEK